MLTLTRRETLILAKVLRGKPRRRANILLNILIRLIK